MVNLEGFSNAEGQWNKSHLVTVKQTFQRLNQMDEVDRLSDLVLQDRQPSQWSHPALRLLMRGIRQRIHLDRVYFDPSLQSPFPGSSLEKARFHPL